MAAIAAPAAAASVTAALATAVASAAVVTAASATVASAVTATVASAVTATAATVTATHCGGSDVSNGGDGNVCEADLNPRRKSNTSVALADGADKPRLNCTVSTDARAINPAR